MFPSFSLAQRAVAPKTVLVLVGQARHQAFHLGESQVDGLALDLEAARPAWCGALTVGQDTVVLADWGCDETARYCPQCERLAREYRVLPLGDQHGSLSPGRVVARLINTPLTWVQRLSAHK